MEELLRLAFLPESLKEKYPHPRDVSRAMESHLRTLPNDLILALAQQGPKSLDPVKNLRPIHQAALKSFDYGAPKALEGLRALVPETTKYAGPYHQTLRDEYLEAAFENPTLSSEAWVYLIALKCQWHHSLNARRVKHPASDWTAFTELPWHHSYDTLAYVPAATKDPAVRSWLWDKLSHLDFFTPEMVKSIPESELESRLLTLRSPDLHPALIERLKKEDLLSAISTRALAHVIAICPPQSRNEILPLLSRHRLLTSSAQPVTTP